MKKITNKKDYDAVFSPQLFDSFPGVRSLKTFEQKWAAKTAWVLANMSHTAYHSPDYIEPLMLKLGATKVICYDRKGAQAFLTIWPDKAILAFRGSQPQESDQLSAGETEDNPFWLKRFPKKLVAVLSNDVLADLNFRKKIFTTDPAVKVHSGFLKETNKLWPDHILTDIKKHARGRPIWVTGHSLGAAMATVAGMYYRFENVITFGEPRVGDNIEREFKAKGHTRYVNGADPVTLVPPELFFGYDHHGDVVKISDRGGAKDPRYDHSIVYYSHNLKRR